MFLEYLEEKITLDPDPAFCIGLLMDTEQFYFWLLFSVVTFWVSVSLKVFFFKSFSISFHSSVMSSSSVALPKFSGFFSSLCFPFLFHINVLFHTGCAGLHWYLVSFLSDSLASHQTVGCLSIRIVFLWKPHYFRIEQQFKFLKSHLTKFLWSS